MIRTTRSICAAAVAAALLASASPARAGEKSMASEAGLGIASAFLSLVYAPIKVMYALGGALVGGAAFAFSGGDHDVADPILEASVRGDYVVTPKHLTGEDDWEFIGRSPESREAHQELADGGGF
jgi:hypothetical protein